MLVPRSDAGVIDPLAYEPGQRRRARAGGRVRSRRSRSTRRARAACWPGGAHRCVPAARRGGVAGSGLDADLVEAIVFLESGGRPEVIAGDDPARAAGLTQILAETGEGFLGMDVDLAASRRLTAQIAAAMRARRRRGRQGAPCAGAARSTHASTRRRRSRGTVRYLTIARERFGGDDLAVVSYHMGIGNLDERPPRLCSARMRTCRCPSSLPSGDLPGRGSSSTPRRPSTSRRGGCSRGLGDDSQTYYGRVLAAAGDHAPVPGRPGAAASSSSTLHDARRAPRRCSTRSRRPSGSATLRDLDAAWRVRLLQRLPDRPGPARLHGRPARSASSRRELGRSRASSTAGSAPRRSRCCSTSLPASTRSSGVAALRSQVTSAVRDDALPGARCGTGNAEATTGYSLHTTGYAFDIRRRYGSRAQAPRSSTCSTRLRALDLIAWVREPRAIHVTVSSAARPLVDALLEPVS